MKTYGNETVTPSATAAIFSAFTSRGCLAPQLTAEEMPVRQNRVVLAPTPRTDDTICEPADLSRALIWRIFSSMTVMELNTCKTQRTSKPLINDCKAAQP